MKKLFIIANWKSYKTTSEAQEWIEKIENGKLKMENQTVIVCPSFTTLPLVAKEIKKKALPFSIGAQDISQFDEGAYTGEVSGKQLKEFCSYVIVGHSERRRNFGETDEIVAEKVKKAVEFGLTPIFCISEINQIHNSLFIIPNSEIVIAYEPIAAIGSGNPDSPEHASKIAGEIKKIYPEKIVIYGGSVTAENVQSFTKMENIDGVLIGSASLDPVEFSSILQHA